MFRGVQRNENRTPDLMSFGAQSSVRETLAFMRVVQEYGFQYIGLINKGSRSTEIAGPSILPSRPLVITNGLKDAACKKF
jgi:hypothetical protein